MTELNPARTWDVFCRVIDNHGDLGVCWRLVCGLANAGMSVRLWVDNASALEWMAPFVDRPVGVAVHAFDAAKWATPAEVVVEAFGCDPPHAYVSAMARCPEGARPVWINLEYLSAEAYVERCHRLPSPQLSGVGEGLTKWFFYPGFTPRTGGLIWHRGDVSPINDAGGWFQTWLHACGVPDRPAARRVSLFCYPNPAIESLLTAWSAPDSQPTDLLVTPGFAQQAVEAWWERRSGSHAARGAAREIGALRILMLPYVSQQVYDALLGSCDLNLVRGEDSLVSALDAGRPLLWHLYPQDDSAHRHKLEAFLDVYLADADESIQAVSGVAHRAWNGFCTPAASDLGLGGLFFDAARDHAERARERLRGGSELVGALLAFVNTRRDRVSATKPG